MKFFARASKHSLMGTAFLWLLLAKNASACAVCYGGSDPGTNRAINMAIFCLLGFIGVVLGGVAGFIFYLRSKQS